MGLKISSVLDRYGSPTDIKIKSVNNIYVYRNSQSI
jgi:hypothetical protein